MKINVFDKINKDISFSISSEPSQPINNSNFINTIKIRPSIT